MALDRERVRRGLARRLRVVADRLAPEAEAAGRRGYGELWAPQDDDEARQLIFNERDREVFDAAGRRDAERLFALTDPDAVVLDLGCGIGRVARHFAPKVRTLWAVDASPTMLRLARQELSGLDNVRFAPCLGTSVPDVPTGSVDLVYSLLVLQHLEREDAFCLLRDVARMLRPSGRAFLTFPNLLSDAYLDSFVHYADTGEVANAARARIYTPEEVRRILPAAGFAIEEMGVGDEMEVRCRLLPAAC